jgi:hypothetical protein
MATAGAGRADKGSSRSSRAFRAPLQCDRLAVGGRGRGEEKPKARQPSSCARKRGVNMTRHDPEIEEPRTAAELIARYRDVRRRLYSPATASELADGKTRTDHATYEAIATIPELSRQPEPRQSETPFQYQTPAREALRAVSTRTRVPIADIFGRNRRPAIAAARHEAIWRVRLVTGWSLPRLGRFFKRDHTTVLHSIREMKRRSAHDPELRTYMISLSLSQIIGAPTPSTSFHFPFAPTPPNLRLTSEGEKDGYR